MPKYKIHSTQDIRGRKGGTFLDWYQSVDCNSNDYKEFEEIKLSLKNDVTIGIKIPKDRWPKKYIKAYGITNLYKIDFCKAKAKRITYTILFHDGIDRFFS